MNTNRNCMIDLMRFIFSIMIVLHHARFKNYFIGGYIGVEFFFMVSGFLMYKQYLDKYSIVELSQINVFKECIVKIKKFYLEFVLAYIVAFVILNIIYINNIKALLDNISIMYGELLLLQIYGFPAFCAIGVAWFLSALIGSYFIILCLLKRNKELYFDILPFIIVVGYGYIIGTYNQIGVIEQDLLGGVLSCGIVKGIC